MKWYEPIQNWSKRDKKVAEYILIYVPEHPKSFDGWYYEHRMIYEKKMRRILRSWESVHHISENKKDNSENNLILCSRLNHDYAHKLGQNGH